MTNRWFAALLGLLLSLASIAAAAPLSFTNDDTLPPEIVTDTTRPRDCSIAFLVMDTSTNDVFAPRMTIEPGADEKPTKGLYPCPAQIPSRVAAQALDTCLSRAADLKSCVFADMSRAFQSQPSVRLTAENTSRCASDLYTHIGLACWRSGDRDICSVACGGSNQEARDLAHGRCQVKHQQACTITGAVRVLPPQ